MSVTAAGLAWLVCARVPRRQTQLLYICLRRTAASVSAYAKPNMTHRMRFGCCVACSTSSAAIVYDRLEVLPRSHSEITLGFRDMRRLGPYFTVKAGNATKFGVAGWFPYVYQRSGSSPEPAAEPQSRRQGVQRLPRSEMCCRVAMLLVPVGHRTWVSALYGGFLSWLLRVERWTQGQLSESAGA